MLVENTLQSVESHLFLKCGNTTPEQRTKTFHASWKPARCRKVPHRKGEGGILYPDNTDNKTGQTVKAILKSKHPDAWTPGADALTVYPYLPDFVNFNITEDSTI
jgi:hypothetical protein